VRLQFLFKDLAESSPQPRGVTVTAQPIVVGVDGGIESIQAASMAWRIAQAGGAECRLVHAFPDLWSVASARVPDLDPGALQPVLEDARRQIADTLTRAVPRPVCNAMEVRFGQAGPVLEDAATRHNADLVVVGRKRHNALSRALGGSTAHHLVRTLNSPLLVTGASANRVRRILVAVDLSDGSARTLSVAERWAAVTGAELRVLHVVEPTRLPPVTGVMIDETDVLRRADVLFQGLVERLSGVPEYQRLIRRGPAVETIAEEAAWWSADVVVVGSHGKGLVDRILIGSTTEILLNVLSASLLVVPIGRPRRQEVGALREQARVLA
jgi:nucleotide-binding universal stress UspA family protein